MGVMKRWNHAHRVEGLAVPKLIRVLAGLQPPGPTDEELAAIKAAKAEAKAAEAEAKAERAAIQAVEAEAEAARRAARLIEWRAEAGPPEPPQNPTGFYRCRNQPETYFPVGTGPWADYRPPGLAWDRAWNQPKPADVPWADELPPPKVFAADPKPIREAVGKAIQGSLF